MQRKLGENPRHERPASWWVCRAHCRAKDLCERIVVRYDGRTVKRVDGFGDREAIEAGLAEGAELAIPPAIQTERCVLEQHQAARRRESFEPLDIRRTPPKVGRQNCPGLRSDFGGR